MQEQFDDYLEELMEQTSALSDELRRVCMYHQSENNVMPEAVVGALMSCAAISAIFLSLTLSPEIKEEDAKKLFVNMAGRVHDDMWAYVTNMINQSKDAGEPLH